MRLLTNKFIFIFINKSLYANTVFLIHVHCLRKMRSNFGRLRYNLKLKQQILIRDKCSLVRKVEIYALKIELTW